MRGVKANKSAKAAPQEAFEKPGLKEATVRDPKHSEVRMLVAKGSDDERRERDEDIPCTD
jgi:hypothetical protein